jgi:hypothetical protein
MRRGTACLCLLAAASCGDGGAPPAGGGGNSVSGTVNGTRWTKASSAYWIGKPSAGSPPAILFMFESAMSCSTLTNFNWDKVLTTNQFVEIALTEAKPRAFQIHKDASLAYQRGDYNPDAESGMVIISEVTPSKSIAGSFDVKFGSDSLKGTFSAIFCPDGVEP